MPIRTCVGCRRTEEKAGLVRIVMTDDGPAADPRGTMPGRGAYVCRNKECLAEALKKNAIARALGVKKADRVIGFPDKV